MCISSFFILVNNIRISYFHLKHILIDRLQERKKLDIKKGTVSGVPFYNIQILFMIHLLRYIFITQNGKTYKFVYNLFPFRLYCRFQNFTESWYPYLLQPRGLLPPIGTWLKSLTRPQRLYFIIKPAKQYHSSFIYFKELLILYN
jgi:hypothetical protein